jgi:hypothetical protein
VLVYAWSPLVVVELAGSGHADGFLLPFLVLAMLWTGRRPWLAGLALGAAAALKLLPGLLLAAFLRRPGWPKLALASLALPLLTLLPYSANGPLQVFAFLPVYFRTEEFNAGLYRWAAVTALDTFGPAALDPLRLLFALALLGLLAGLALRRPSGPPESTALALLGVYLLLAPSFHAWYAVWLVPLLAPLLRPGRLGLAFDQATGWLLVTGLLCLAYVWWVAEKPEYWALVLQHGLAWLFLLSPPLRAAWQRRNARAAPAILPLAPEPRS